MVWYGMVWYGCYHKGFCFKDCEIVNHVGDGGHSGLGFG